jgi:hypothetical protein
MRHLNFPPNFMENSQSEACRENPNLFENNNLLPIDSWISRHADIERGSAFSGALSYCCLLSIRAFLLACSAGERARLMLPTGVLSGVECPVTSI